MNRQGKPIIRANLQFSNGDQPLAVITSSDTGHGIPKAVLNCLFEPSLTTKPLEEGKWPWVLPCENLGQQEASGSVTVLSFQGWGTTFTPTFSCGKVEGAARSKG